MIFNLIDSNGYYLSEDNKFLFKTLDRAFIRKFPAERSEDSYIYELYPTCCASFFNGSDGHGAGFHIYSMGLSARSIEALVNNIQRQCPNFFDLYNYPEPLDNNFYISSKSPAPSVFEIDFNNDIFVDFFNAFSSNDFTTNLYAELLDNSEQSQMAKSFLNDTDPDKQLDPTYWTDIQLKFFKFVEEYNKNVLSLRATKKVDANVSGSISQSGQQQQIDLSPISSGLTNIANKLQRVDENQETKNITQTINDLSLSNQTVITTVENAPYNPLLEDDIDF